MIDKGKVTVLLAVYNGERYLREMLTSLLNQTYGNLRVIISDDGSTDGSADIINEFCNSHGNLFVSAPSHKKFGSASRHFMYLLNEYKDSEMIMFADQDDVWLPEKIEKSVACMDSDVPCLVHCDCSLTNEKLNITEKSFHKFSGLKPDLEFPKMLIENCVQGASMLINSKLIRLCSGEKEVIIHDWWIAKIAASEGKIIYIDEPLFLYRQHTDNQIGASTRPNSVKYIYNRIFRSDIKKRINNAREEALKISEYVSGKNRELSLGFSDSVSLGKLRRVSFMRKNKMLPENLLNKLKFVIWG